MKKRTNAKEQAGFKAAIIVLNSAVEALDWLASRPWFEDDADLALTVGGVKGGCRKLRLRLLDLVVPQTAAVNFPDSPAFRALSSSDCSCGRAGAGKRYSRACAGNSIVRAHSRQQRTAATRAGQGSKR